MSFYATAWSLASLPSHYNEANSLNRQRIPASAISVSGTKVKLTLSKYAGADYKMSEVFVGHPASSGNAWKFDGNQVRVTFDGGNNGCTILHTADKVSDEITFALDEAKDLIVSFYGPNGTYGEWPYLTNGAATGISDYYIAGHAADVGVDDVAGLYTQANIMLAFNKLEAFIPDITKDVPAASQADTFVTPAAVAMIGVPALSLTDTFVTPAYGVAVGIAVPSLSLIDTFLIPTHNAAALTRARFNLNVSSKHISVKIRDTASGISELREARFLVNAVTGAKTDVVDLNITETRASIKFQGAEVLNFVRFLANVVGDKEPNMIGMDIKAPHGSVKFANASALFFVDFLIDPMVNW